MFLLAASVSDKGKLTFQMFLLQGYGSAVKMEEVAEVEVVEDRHMNVNVSSSGQGTRTVVLQIPKVG